MTVATKKPSKKFRLKTIKIPRTKSGFDYRKEAIIATVIKSLGLAISRENWAGAAWLKTWLLNLEDWQPDKKALEDTIPMIPKPKKGDLKNELFTY